MNESGNNKVLQILRQFDELEPISAGAEWERKLFAGIAAAGNHNAGKKSRTRLVVFAAVFAALNGLLLLRAGNGGGGSEAQRADILNTVSDQLLVNATTFK